MRCIDILTLTWLAGISPGYMDPFVRGCIGNAPNSKMTKLSQAVAYVRDGKPRPYTATERPATR